MKVFVSSIVGGFEQYRAATKEAIEALDHEPCLMNDTVTASPEPSQAECFNEIGTADVVILILGARYGALQESGKSATHEEVDHARSLGKPILAFVEEVDDREPGQEEFLSEIGDWEQGIFWKSFSDPTELAMRIVRALKHYQERTEHPAATATLERLPPTCHKYVELMRQTAPAQADKLETLLADPASRQPGILSEMARKPPRWLTDAEYPAWEAIREFIDAHDIGNSAPARERAIEAGSPRSGLHLTWQAVTMADNGNTDAAEELMSRVPSDYPLIEIARARLANDPSAVVERVRTAELLESDDSDLVLYSVSMLLWAYWCLERFDSATEVLRDANERFSHRAWLLFHQAHATLGMVDQLGLDELGSHDMLTDAVELALRSRDCFRSWDGPSHLAVAVALRALLFLDDPQRAVDLALTQPNGEATEAEASDPDVQTLLANAYLMLGRYREVDYLQLERIDESERALIRAGQARGLGAAEALGLMRTALRVANDDSSRRRALLGLASFGEVDDEAMSDLSEDESALYRGVAAFNREEYAEAVTVLFRTRFKSYHHAYYLAQAQDKAGEVDEAIATLAEATEHLGIDSLRQAAVDILVENRKFIEAEALATEALALVQSLSAKHRLRSVLTGISEQREDWQAMESNARAWLRESPQNAEAAWCVVYALHRQLKNRQAWALMAGHELMPTDHDTASLMIQVIAGEGATDGYASRLLEIAATYSDHEIVAGSALAALMSGGDRVSLSDQQRTRFQDLLEGFLSRFPESPVMRAVSSADPDKLFEQFALEQQASAQRAKPILEKVRSGHFPYGVLRNIRELPYATLLLSRAADALTAIPADPVRRGREREAASSALGNKVAIDTSVAAVGISTDLDLRRLSGMFASVYVADELIIDARAAVIAANSLGDGVLTYNPGINSPQFWEIDEAQRTAAQNASNETLELLTGWQSLKTGHLAAPLADQNEEFVRFKPWDASVRLALARGCPLWCDDLGLRALAESEGITTFGTWALCEALWLEPEEEWLPTREQLTLRFLLAQIADVPVTVAELEQTADDSGDPDFAFEFFLCRPVVWTSEPSAVLRSYITRVMHLAEGEHKFSAARLLQASCCGLGAATDPSNRQGAVGGLLGLTLLVQREPELVPVFLVAARSAAGKLDPVDWIDPLEDAVRHLLAALEGNFGARDAALIAGWLFSEAEPDDRRAVTAIVVAGDRR